MELIYHFSKNLSIIFYPCPPKDRQYAKRGAEAPLSIAVKGLVRNPFRPYLRAYRLQQPRRSGILSAEPQ